MEHLKFIFSLIDGGGNTVPILRTARKLRQAGHYVWILSNPCLKDRVEAAGAGFLCFRRAPLHDPSCPETDYVKAWETVQPHETTERIRDRLLFGPSMAITEDVLDAIGAIQPHAVISDYVLFGGMIAAEAARVPSAIMVPHVYPLPHAAARNRAAFTYMFHRLIAPGTASLNKVRNSFGLPELQNVAQQYTRADRMLLCTYRAFDAPLDDLPAHVVYVGPQLDLPSPKALAAKQHPPLVVVSFSTAYQQQEEVFTKVAEVLGTLPVRAVVLRGPALAHCRLPHADNLEVRDFVPHSELLPAATLMITHAGHGTAIGGLGHGLPLLCLPFAQDQFDVARRVAQLGAGLELQRNSLPSKIRDAIVEILNNRAYHDAACAVRNSFIAEDDPALVVRELENLAVRSPACSEQFVH